MTPEQAVVMIIVGVCYSLFIFLLGYDNGYTDAEKDQKKKDTQ